MPVGAECAGIVVETGPDTDGVAVGDRVFGYVPASLATEAVAQAKMLAPIPPGMPAAIAAALPMAYLTALYGLIRVADLRKGQSVLIHAAAGGVGLAAVRVAQRQRATIFATAGSEEKRDLLIQQGVAHVLNSRSLDFADEILASDSRVAVSTSFSIRWRAISLPQAFVRWPSAAGSSNSASGTFGPRKPSHLRVPMSDIACTT